MASRTPLISVALVLALTGLARWAPSVADQGAGELAQAPMNAQATIKPALIMAVDDSGSMSFDILIPGIRDGQSKWIVSAKTFGGTEETVCTTVMNCYFYLFPHEGFNTAFPAGYALAPLDSAALFRASEVNTSYFNPLLRYEPWINPDGTRTPNAVIAQTRADIRSNQPESNVVYDMTNYRVDASEMFVVYDGMTIPANTWVNTPATTPCVIRNANGSIRTNFVNTGGQWQQLTADVTLAGVSCLIAFAYFPPTFYTTRNNNLLPPNYGYRADRIVEVDALNMGKVRKYQILPGNFDSTAQYNAAIQNFANWFQYRRNRLLSTIGAMTDSMDGIRDLRVGYFTINNRTNVTMYDTGTADGRTGLYTQGFHTLKAKGGTPNRDAVAYLGEQFRRVGGSEVPVISACQRNVGLLFTDGYTNSKTGPVGYGNTDSGLGAPYADIHDDTMADIATAYYSGNGTPLRVDGAFASLRGRVPVSEEVCRDPAGNPSVDCQRNLHMNFYGITLGAAGLIYGPHNPNQTNDPYKFPPTWSATNPRTVDDGNVIDELWHATINGRGKMFNARSPDQITMAMREVLSSADGGASPSASIGSTGTRLGSNSLSVQPSYAATNSSTDWHSRLIASTVGFDTTTKSATLTEKWRAETQLVGRSATRAIRFARANGTVKPKVEAFLPAAFTGTGLETYNELCADALSPCKGLYDQLRAPATALPLLATYPSSAEMIQYLRGDRTLEGDADRTNLRLRRRTTLLGDIVNSDVVISARGDDYGHGNLYTNGKYDELKYAAYLKSKYATQTSMVYAGANDGMLHAFNGDTGSETFAYIPTTSLGHMGNLLFPFDRSRTAQLHQHRYYVDGPVVVSDVYDGSWKTALVASSGAGGKNVFALDVTAQSSSPAVMWELSDKVTANDSTGVPIQNRLGYVLGRPVVVPVADASGVKWKAILGNGYNSTRGKAALLVVDMSTGAVTSIEASEAEVTASNGLGNLVAIDQWQGRTKNRGRDGLVDTVYAADQHGSVWKFDLRDYSLALGGKPLYTARDRANKRQPIIGGLEVSAAGSGVMVFFGTGSYSFTADATDTSMQTVYGILDSGVAVSGRSALQQQFIRSETGGMRSASRTIGGLNTRGWYLDLGLDANGDGTTVARGERFLGYPRLQNGILFFLTYTPNTDIGGVGCALGGDNYLYGLDALSGAARLQDTRMQSIDGTAPPEGTGAMKTDTGGSGAAKELATFLTSNSDPAVAPGDDQPPPTQCSVILQAPGAPSLYMLRPCGRLSWRQIR
ncbi:pilus assembly protein [Lysobacter sp. cf310]|uniref:pilus assembly protein n=1 Tax=Lysobacter sp. cf310 TaxID=1761790 RepID=UPI0008EA228D|nr:PilC/PilY family type IV pilus protein [Lysobacter sp. cf310]SFK32295.1 type IV pilus assembly protein PilY1 [Lysobacter sp. cf310]